VLTQPARPEHLEPVRALLAAAALPADGLADQFPAGYVVAVREGAVVGAAGIEVYGADGLLRSVVVAATLRGSGLGHTLTFDRIRWARERGLGSLWLLTTTAASFFARIGFAPAERNAAPPVLRASTEFAHACPASAVCQRLDLALVPAGEGWHRWVADRMRRATT
jgi:amino-acid N-acetyltransferase